MVRDDTMKPKQLNSVKDHKLTRRRVVKLASAVGLSSAVASQMTVDDVKASDSDQVTVSLDVDGQRKYTMAADRLDWLQRATKANEYIKSNHRHKKGVVSIGMSGGDKEDNPHVVVKLDKNSNEKDERRGEIPENRNGVRIETQEVERELHLACDTQCVSEGTNFPGGQKIDINNTGSWGTSGPRVIADDYEWVGWTTAGHCFPGCDSDDTTMWHTPDESSCDYPIGTGAAIAPYEDVGFIYYSNDHDITPSPWNAKPSDHSEAVQINGTLSEEGMGVIDDEYDGENKIFAYGAASCFTRGELDEWNVEDSASGIPNNCRDELRNQMTVDLSCTNETMAKGDSGGIFFTPDPNTDSWYALGSVVGYYEHICVTGAIGAQGFTIQDKWNCAWR